MEEKKSDIARKAWNLLRVALLWARKSSLFKRKLIMCQTKNLIKSLRFPDTTKHHALQYGDREFSFDDTPIFRLKMYRTTSSRFKFPRIPCLKPQLDFDYDFEFNNEEEDEIYHSDVARTNFLKGGRDDNDNECEVHQEFIPYEDEGIDLKAEAFITKFYEQIKLQRQISDLQFNEMLNRGVS